jgi:choline dehydrogenase-like flavoprotein
VVQRAIYRADWGAFVTHPNGLSGSIGEFEKRRGSAGLPIAGATPAETLPRGPVPLLSPRAIEYAVAHIGRSDHCTDRLAPQRRVDQELQLQVRLPVRFQRAADQRLVQGASRDARPAGSFALGELFPGFEQNLARAGAVPLRVAVDVRMELPGFDPLPPRDLGWDVYSMSRPLIERVVRQCVQQHSNITFRKRCRVRELVASADRATVTGVRYKNGDGNDETLSADLIVDASGRSVLTLSLLEAIGQPQPEETLIGVNIASPGPLEGDRASLGRDGLPGGIALRDIRVITGWVGAVIPGL